jgi:type IV pilus assembly protein PilV
VRHISHGRPGSEAGSTLIEILVSVIVLSFGLLGLVGLQVSAMRNSREALLQATAVRLASDLAERMRGNPAVAMQHGAAANPYLIADARSAPAATSLNCVRTSCATPLDVATWDANEWLGRVFAAGNGLPGARVAVCFDESPYDGGGLPVWPCSGTGEVMHVKLGWTRASTNRSSVGKDAFERVDEAGSRPSVVVPIVVGGTS